MEPLRLMRGGRRAAAEPQPDRWRSSALDAVHNAIHAGFAIGSPVHLGHVAGRIVGYNIGAFGRYTGAGFPLLVRTEFGIAKCSVSELTPG